ncbi:hypothetical protein PCANC_12278 [Puccinia coronata f. sp. avenae]|uniref:Retroviral polymerase SH3-like domain-containing protein n=1 Tax=Puccinia coronata f. sp. avenae TaxID=200324 RepID=A0A2N5SZ58_9BASI|nr:hypothetical protein PCANC_12278 [Puccinia coronata f. sp. avenae]
MAAEWWGEAAVTATCITNCLLSLSRSRCTPMQLLLKMKAKPHFLKPFGCKAWALKPKANRDEKFDTVSWDGTLIGYTNDMLSYRILWHSDLKIINSRQVLFDKNVFPTCPAISKSLGAMPAREEETIPLFHSNPILPFEEESQIETASNSPEDQVAEEVDSHPVEPVARKKWIYVQGFQPEKPVESSISKRNIIPGGRTRRQACFATASVDPKSHSMAMNSHDRQHWMEAELKEINNMKKHQVWIEHPCQPTDCPIASTWAYCCKLGPNNQVIEFKARICAQGFRQTFGVNFELNVFLETISFHAAISDPCVFHRPDKPGKPATWIYAHIDDLVIISHDPLVLKTEFERKFDIKYLGTAEFLLGMNIDRTPSGLHIHQMQYVKQKLLEYGLDTAPHSSCPMNPKVHLRKATAGERDELQNLGVNYRALVGSLNYLSVLTRPDISHAVSVLSQHLEAPGIQHFQAAEQVFRYLAGTKQVGLVFTKEPSLDLSANVDSNWGNCPNTRRSATGFVILTSQQVLSRKASRQATVSL